MRGFLKPQLLIIDDLGLTSFTQEQTEAFYEIVSERHHTGSIVITSNRPPGDWPGLFPDQVLANSLMDRLSHNQHDFDDEKQIALETLERKLTSIITGSESKVIPISAGKKAA
jgi:DNA replication protein DnaC